MTIGPLRVPGLAELPLVGPALLAERLELSAPQIIAKTGWTTDELSAAIAVAEHRSHAPPHPNQHLTLPERRLAALMLEATTPMSPMPMSINTVATTRARPVCGVMSP